jgi:hypothetical protein
MNSTTGASVKSSNLSPHTLRGIDLTSDAAAEETTYTILKLCFTQINLTTILKFYMKSKTKKFKNKRTHTKTCPYNEGTTEPHDIRDSTHDGTLFQHPQLVITYAKYFTSEIRFPSIKLQHLSRNK